MKGATKARALSEQRSLSSAEPRRRRCRVAAADARGLGRYSQSRSRFLLRRLRAATAACRAVCGGRRGLRSSPSAVITAAAAREGVSRRPGLDMACCDAMEVRVAGDTAKQHHQAGGGACTPPTNSSKTRHQRNPHRAADASALPCSGDDDACCAHAWPWAKAHWCSAQALVLRPGSGAELQAVVLHPGSGEVPRHWCCPKASGRCSTRQRHPDGSRDIARSARACHHVFNTSLQAANCV
eukprot:366461-Chlamydomonas_euryale.AAC.9